MDLNFRETLSIMLICVSICCSSVFAVERNKQQEQDLVAKSGAGRLAVEEQVKEAEIKKKVELNEKVVTLKNQDMNSDNVMLDIDACTKAGYDYARMVKRPYVEHGGCWCKTPPCNYSSMCEGIANNKKKECLIEKGWTLEDVQAVSH